MKATWGLTRMFRTRLSRRGPTRFGFSSRAVTILRPSKAKHTGTTWGLPRASAVARCPTRDRRRRVTPRASGTDRGLRRGEDRPPAAPYPPPGCRWTSSTPSSGAGLRSGSGSPRPPKRRGGPPSHGGRTPSSARPPDPARPSRRFCGPSTPSFRTPPAPPSGTSSAGWAAIARGEDTLISAPTGSGKTLAAFLWSINTLVQDAARSSLRDELAVLYVSPLRALGNDIRRNLEDPLEEIRRLAAAHGAPFPTLRVAVRSGDTPAGDRARMLRRPPHVLITTPESLYLLLTAERSRELLRTVRTVIVDEIHAVAPDKRGAHLALSLERLDRLAGRRAQRIGLSATQKPLAEIACLLTGVTPDGRPRPCAIVDIGHRRPWELSVDVPGPPRGPLATHEMWDAVYDRLAVLARQHRTTLVFVHTRRLAERVAHHLTARLGTGAVAVHHGSLSREVRYDTERRLKAGQASVVVATASLELGIDIGHVDLVCHLGAPRSLATLLQRVGRSGHGVGGVARGILFPLTRDELLQCAAAVRAVHAGELDAVAIPQCPLDVLAQQIVAAAAAEEIPEDDLFALVRQSYPYRSLDRREFLQVVEMLSEGIAQRWGRASALLHRD